MREGLLEPEITWQTYQFTANNWHLAIQCLYSNIRKCGDELILNDLQLVICLAYLTLLSDPISTCTV